MRLFIGFVSLFSIVSCSSSDQEASIASSSTSVETNASNPVSHLANTDSIQILYYDNPDGDSARYTRYYKYTSSKDTAVINPLIESLKGEYVTVNDNKDCRSEGKIYAIGNGEVLKTVYFSTRGDSCSYLYLIQNGNFLYFNLNKNLGEILNAQRRNAVEPEAKRD